MTERPLLYRSVKLEEGSGRTIVAPCIVPYGKIARVSDGGPPYNEMFEPGVFARNFKAVNRVLLRGQHGEDFLSVVGRATALHETTEGLGGEFLCLESNSGDQALAMVKAGIYTGASVGFMPFKTRTGPGGEVVRVTAHLDHVALVMEPAYVEASSLTVRQMSNCAVDELRPIRNDDLEERLTQLGITR